MHPLRLQLCDLRMDIGKDLTASGSGEIDLVTPFGPRLALKGELEDGADALKAMFSDAEERGPAGELFIPEELPFTGRGTDHEVEGRWRWAWNRSFRSGASVEAVVSPSRFVLSPRREHVPKGENYLLVAYLGRPCGLWPDSQFIDGFRYLEGTEVRYMEHRFILANTWQRFQSHVNWHRTGTFAYIGPAIGNQEDLDALLHRFCMLLGVAMVSPVDPVGFLTRTSSGQWLRSEWRAPTKSYDRYGHQRVIGAHHLNHGGRHIAEWLEAGLRCWDEVGVRLGLDLTLRYLDQVPSRPEPEMRCLDLVIAIERLVTNFLKVEQHPAASGSKIGNKIRAMMNTVGANLLSQHDVDVIHHLRRCLGHVGDLPMERVHGLEELQILHLTEGWLISCFHRLLASIFEVDVPIVDLGALGYPAHRPSEGGFVGPPFEAVKR